MNKLGRLRISTAVGYLAPARIRPNLEVRGRTLTRRVVIEGRRVTGVEVESADGSTEVLRAALVVLCAGAIGSPAVLLRSGLGPRSELERSGIDVVADLPGVGADLDDHPGLAVICQARHPELIDTDAPIIQTVLRWTASGSRHRNDLFAETASFARMSGRPPSFAVLVSLFRTASRGRLRLASADPHEPPVIESGFGNDAGDDERLAEALLEGVRLAQSGPLADLVDEVVWPRLPLDEDGARQLAHTRAASGYHPSCTARMGPDDDPGAVVDQYGRCRGVDGLVVGDASIMPFVPRANTNLTSIMIGERIGEWLRTDPARYGL
jgi:choline dehydrogenase